jgi:hypothetical protein
VILHYGCFQQRLTISTYIHSAKLLIGATSLDIPLFFLQCTATNSLWGSRELPDDGVDAPEHVGASVKHHNKVIILMHLLVFMKIYTKLLDPATNIKYILFIFRKRSSLRNHTFLFIIFCSWHNFKMTVSCERIYFYKSCTSPIQRPVLCSKIHHTIKQFLPTFEVTSTASSTNQALFVISLWDITKHFWLYFSGNNNNWNNSNVVSHKLTRYISRFKLIKNWHWRWDSYLNMHHAVKHILLWMLLSKHFNTLII